MQARAFTLVELLIVVAIIAILAAIAVPNFLEAQTRAKVSRTKADMRALAVALEAFRVDNTKLPSNSTNVMNPILRSIGREKETETEFAGIGRLLTSPVAYVSSIPFDIFNTEALRFWFSNWPELPPLILVQSSVLYFPVGRADDGVAEHSYTLQSAGPDLQIWFQIQNKSPGDPFYDPTNGTVSQGDIWNLDMAGLSSFLLSSM